GGVKKKKPPVGHPLGESGITNRRRHRVPNADATLRRRRAPSQLFSKDSCNTEKIVGKNSQYIGFLGAERNHTWNLIESGQRIAKALNPSNTPLRTKKPHGSLTQSGVQGKKVLPTSESGTTPDKHTPPLGLNRPG